MRGSTVRARGAAGAARDRVRRVAARAAAARASLPPWLLLALTALAVALLTWPITTLMPTLGLDGSWPVALSMATQDGLDFGRDVLFTYGPLGFLKEPLAIQPWTARLAWAYTAGIHLLLCAGLLWALLGGLRSLVLAALATLFLAPLFTQEPALPAVFIGAVAVGSGRVPARAVPWVAGVGGVVVGIELLGKLNTGVTALALAAIAAGVAPLRRRDAAIALGASAAVTLVVAWIATGQALSAIPGFVSGSLEIASGYSEAMGLEAPASEWEYWVALILAATGFAAAWAAGAGLTTRARAGLVAMWAILAFTTFKSGFVRHDPGHVNIFFATMAGGLAAFAWAARRQTVALVGVLALTALFASLRTDPADTVQPLTRADRFFSQLGTLSDGSETNRLIGAATRVIGQGYAVDPATLDAIGAHDVHIDPWDTAIVRAYGLEWDPLPVFQSYSAYTEDLDERNADELRDPDGPARVMRAASLALDGRNPAWESPAAVRAMLCFFRPTSANERWLVLARAPRPRCGEPREIARTDARWGEPMPVPRARPDEVVYAEADGVAVGGLDKVGAAAHRPELRYAELDRGRLFRLVPDTARNGLVMAVPPAADWPAPYGLRQNARTIAFRRNSGGQPDGRVGVRWFAMPLR